MKKYYKISEIAKMFNITRTALIHYDKWGVLSPSIRNEKNYRFYTSEDMQKLELILALKESGLSLKKIQSYISEKIDKTSVELLVHQKEEIDKKIESLKIQSRVIEKRIENLNKFNSITIYEGIIMEEYPESSIIHEPIGYGPLMSYDSAVSRLKKRLSQEGQLSSKFGICLDIAHKDYNGKYKMKYIFDYLTTDQNTQDLIKIPKSTFLRCIHEGQHTTIEKTINRILSYAHENGYKCGDEAYFVPLFDYWESMTNEFIGEVIIPLKSDD